MAVNQFTVTAAMEAAGRIIKSSLCETDAGWLALIETDNGKRLAWVPKGMNRVNNLWKGQQMFTNVKGVTVQVFELNANNAALVRRIVKWTAPKACGKWGTSIGFSDWLGTAGAAVTSLFAKRELRPVLVEFTPEDSAALGRNFLEAVDTATWGVLEAGYKEGYGANATGLKTEEDIVKALLYGYSMIGLDVSDKINRKIELMSDTEVNKRFNEFNDTFKAAVHASYLNQEFKVGSTVIKYTETQLHRIVLEFGQAIMHVQFLYNSYLKNTPWDIDFELYLSKPGKALSVAEHFLVANELDRNNVTLATVCIDPLLEPKSLNEELEAHCAIAAKFGYRLSFRNADLDLVDTKAVHKYLRGRVHFKLNNILALSALELMAKEDSGLLAKTAAASGVSADNMPSLALAYTKALNPKAGNMGAAIRAFLDAHHEAYLEIVREKTKAFLAGF